jgi:aspartyl-tRNA(Asn)/glutamyl-tRNA(Gln) amidotransferase subunit A
MSITDYAVPVYYIISSAEASSNLSRYDGVNFGLRGEGVTYAEQIKDSRTRGFGHGVQRRIMFGNFVLSEENYEDYYMKALALRQKIKAAYDDIFKTADLVLSPTVPDIHPPDSIIPQTSYAYTFTVSPALAGLPSISTTCGFRTTGLPIGMSLTGRKFAEQTVLQAADCFERLFSHHTEV